MKRTIDKKYLFTDRMGHKLYKEDIIETLIDIETNDCNYLFIQFHFYLNLYLGVQKT